MIDEIKKSINSTLYERTTSPLFGTLIFSWSASNWKIIYLTLFVSEDKIQGNKIDYIICNFFDIEHLIFYPAISTVVLLTIVPFISNGAYWLSLKFNKWKKEQKNLIDKSQLLSLEQSIELREQISNLEERFEKLLISKNEEIKALNIKIENYKSDMGKPTEVNRFVDTNLDKEKEEKELIKVSDIINENPNLLTEYDSLVDSIQRNLPLTQYGDVSPKLISILEANDIIKNLNSSGRYSFTDKWKQLHKLINQ